MTPTRYYANLVEEFEEYSKLLEDVPDEVDLSDRHQLLIRSFVLLIHGAIEEYLEKLTFEVCKEALKKFEADGSICIAFLNLVTREAVLQVSDDRSGKKITSDVARNLSEFAAEALSNQGGRVGKNHGIKISNQDTLFGAIGVSVSEISAETSAGLHSLGAKRGGFAHSGKIAVLETKNSILNDVRTLIQGLNDIDKAAMQCLSVKTVA